MSTHPFVNHRGLATGQGLDREASINIIEAVIEHHNSPESGCTLAFYLCQSKLCKAVNENLTYHFMISHGLLSVRRPPRAA